MRAIACRDVVSAVSELCIRAAYELPPDVICAVEAALEKETDGRARGILQQLLENADIARKERIPLCQDTGLTVVFVQQGNQFQLDPPDVLLNDVVNQGIAEGYEKGLLRKSVVAEPLNERKNTRTNTPAVIHHEFVPGDQLKLTVMLKGGGCENKSQFKMFNPTEKIETVCEWIVEVVKNAGANACPPFVVGVGIGGNFEHCCYLSKKALIRRTGKPHEDSFYAEFEKRILEDINNTGLGPQGMGGNTTALSVQIETAPCHIASLPVAVNIECHSHRHYSLTL